jgi:uncharacterized protein YutE (UPF0331/DUF86 family)
MIMTVEYSGIERRLDELSERLTRLKPLANRDRSEFDQDPYLRDIVERNLEVASQCVIDICHRLISLEKGRKPGDYYEAILLMGELNILPSEFARHLAPIAGFRNILVHQYVSVNWDIVYRNLKQIDDLKKFGDLIRDWLNK